MFTVETMAVEQIAYFKKLAYFKKEVIEQNFATVNCNNALKSCHTTQIRQPAKGG